MDFEDTSTLMDKQVICQYFGWEVLAVHENILVKVCKTTLEALEWLQLLLFSAKKSEF